MFWSPFRFLPPLGAGDSGDDGAGGSPSCSSNKMAVSVQETGHGCREGNTHLTATFVIRLLQAGNESLLLPRGLQAARLAQGQREPPAARVHRLRDHSQHGADGGRRGTTAPAQLRRVQQPVGADGLLVESATGTDGLPVDPEYNEARAKYLARRKARIDKEMHAKERGGELNFRG